MRQNNIFRETEREEYLFNQGLIIVRENQVGRSRMFYLTHVECGDPSHQETDQPLHYPTL